MPKKKKRGGNLFKNFLGVLLFLGAMSSVCFAKDELTIKYPINSQARRDVFFDEKNIVPGWEKSVIFRAENEDNDEVADFFITFDVGGDKDLAKMLKLYVIRVSDGKYQIGGPGERTDLDEVDEKKLFIDQLSPGKGKNYKIKIVFDENAGNEYQGKKVKLDIDFRLEAEAARGGGQNETDGTRGPLTEQALASQLGQGETFQEGEGVEIGQEAAAGEEGEVAGTSTCQGFPLWVWILALVVFAFIFWWDRSDKFKKKKKVGVLQYSC